MWRSRLRPLISSAILFGLGVTTCLMFLQMSQNSIDGPAIYTNSQEYQSPQSMGQQQTQQETPCDTSITSNNNNGVNGIGIETFNHVRAGNSKRNAIFGIEEKSITPQSSTNFGGGQTSHGALQPSSILPHSETLKKLQNYKNGINSDNPDGPTVWVVTPTFYRPEQKPEITRLAQALMPVRNFVHWILGMVF